MSGLLLCSVMSMGPSAGGQTVSALVQGHPATTRSRIVTPSG